MSISSKAFIAAVVVCGMAVAGRAFAHWQRTATTGFLALLVVSVVASITPVKLPGINATMAMNLPFILLAVAALGPSESMLLGCCSTLTQCLGLPGKKIDLVQAMFNVSNMALTVAATQLIFLSAALSAPVSSAPLRLVEATAGFFVANTVPVAIIISLTEKRGPLRTWADMFQLSFPFYAASAGIAGAALSISGQIGWLEPMATLLVMLGILHSYRRYFSTPSLSTANDLARGHRVGTGMGARP